MSSKRQKDGVVSSLRDLFGNAVHIEIIKAVASECNFDVERSSNVLLEMTQNINPTPTPPKKNPTPRKAEVPRQAAKSRNQQETERVKSNISSGYKVLVLLRGLPGSGKSHLARTLIDDTLGPGNNSHHILSTDDFFMQTTGYYVYEPGRISEAHEWNQKRAFQAMSKGLSPVIIDNTNCQMWEMKPYAMMATDYGYVIEILEPDTLWAFHDKELSKRNTHNVPRAKIKEMLERYHRNVTPTILLTEYKLQYKFQKPPQFRLLPPILNGFTPVKKPVFEIKMPGPDLMDFSQECNKKTKDEYHLWDMNPVDQILMCDINTPSTEPLQPAKIETPSSVKSGFLSDIENAWGIDEKALQSWEVVRPLTEQNIEMTVDRLDHVEVKVTTNDNSSNVDFGDFNKPDDGVVTLIAESRDINVSTPVRMLPPPKKSMIDQSCMTEDVEEMDDEISIQNLKELFPGLPRSHLQEFFDKCRKNFQWTVDLLLEDNNLEVEEKEVTVDNKETTNAISVTPPEPTIPKDKVFKRKAKSEMSLELKKELESKIDISKNFYSDHVYKIKQSRFGTFDEPQPSTSNDIDYVSSNDEEDDDDDDDPKNMIELNLGEFFVTQLETLFGATGDFPQGYQPVVQVPTSLARQLYTYYIESICQQMETQNSILDSLIKEDEEFARKLQEQEEDPLVENNRGSIPNLKEIMEEEAVLTAHKRQNDSWKNMTADNLAAMLTKQKLFNAFPNLDKNALLEIWHAYDYNYNKTVEDLITSVGLDISDGTKKSLVEPPVSSNLLDEMRKDEVECSEFEDTEDHPPTFYRDEANKHLRKRSELYEKARSYHQKGMTEVALFYSELAKKETLFFDKANHFAASAFVEQHNKRLQKFDTLDLHYLYVKEAIANLDIFIDRNINLLRCGGAKSSQILYIITGWGKNSQGGRCKVKPAVITRLKKRNIGFVTMNPGFLRIKVGRESPMTNELA